MLWDDGIEGCMLEAIDAIGLRCQRESEITMFTTKYILLLKIFPFLYCVNKLTSLTFLLKLSIILNYL